MKLLKGTLSILFFVSGPLFCQIQDKLAPFSSNKAVDVKTLDLPVSNIIRSSTADSSILKVELKNAQYDFYKNNFPYYIISKRTAYEQSASPQLIIKKTVLVTDAHSGAIKKFYSQYLSNNFETIALASLCRGQNLNQYKLFPFRLNAQNQIEELVEYDVSWQITGNDNNRQLKTSSSFKSNSVLASGNWYKIAITRSGIYKLSRSFLAGCGMDVTSIDPRKIRIYGNGGHALPELNSAPRYDDLEENAIQVVGESDGVLNEEDYVLFYARNKDRWTKTSNYQGLRFRHDQNIFSDTAFYFINADIGNGKRIASQPSSLNPANVATNSYDYYNYHEIDAVNFVKSGRQFFGEYFDITNSYGFIFDDGNFIVGDTIIADITVAGRGPTGTAFNFSGNGINLNLLTLSVDLNNYLADYVSLQTKSEKALNTNANSINLSITKQTATCIGYLDKFTINARRELKLQNNQFQFRDSRITGTGNVCTFNIATPLNNGFSLWNVNDFLNPFIQSYYTTSGSINFTAPSDSLLEYVIAASSAYYTPKFISKIQNQNLHAAPQADYVIVTHPMFKSHAERLGRLHQQNEGFTYYIATTEEIYNEFSSGMQDISAIRDFTRMLYTRHIGTGKQPKYVLLFGDGSYNNKNRDLILNSNFIPTYQTPLGLSLLNSTATDDFFALMDPNEGATPENLGSMDLGVGRLISRSLGEADAITAKIENYYRNDHNFQIADQAPENCNPASEYTHSDWRNWLIFLADDEDYSTHMNDANKIAIKAATQNPMFNIDKIYLDAYQQFSTPGGQRYPDAYIDLEKRIKKGCLVFNYTGHGGEVGLTAERLVDIESINNWENYSKLPLFVTATCEFTRYDDPARTSAGELCLLSSKGGAIGLFTTCRLAFSNTNLILNNTLYDFMFKKLPDGRKPCLGDIIRLTKDTLNQGFNYANFHLIGDPAVTLRYPEQKVITTKINSGVVTTTSSDTLSALEKITISGYVADTMGNKLNNFNGIVYPTVFDKQQTIQCLLNDAESWYQIVGQPFVFQSQKNVLFRGKAEVKNGDFSFSFMVPKDISFAYGPGRISYFATNGQQDAGGYYSNLVVGGGSDNPVPDNEGPQVSMYLNDKNFVSGGTTSEKPVFYAHLIDSSGINTLGTSIGHDITAVLDGNASKPHVLNDYYETNLNSYQSGRIRYPFNELNEGHHTLAFKVWDIQNNSNTVSLDFVVAPSAELALNHVLNYPNPFTTGTKFYLEHNQACNPLKVTVQVFTISGKLVKTLQKSVTCEGFRPEGIDWDGKDDFGDKLGRGVYIYKVAILNSENKKAEKTEKLVILN